MTGVDAKSIDVEIIVLAIPQDSDRLSVAMRTLKPHPVLGNIIFNEDPALPLDPEDWPEL